MSSELFTEYVELLKAAKAMEPETYEGTVAPLSESDAVMIVDVQNDFLPAADAPTGGRFGVADGAAAAAKCVDLIAAAAAKNSLIIASRDYHPAEHVSFMPTGPFPSHCLQGSDGSKFFPVVGDALAAARKAGSRVNVVFKGFDEGVDSFGAFPYSEPQADGRLCRSGGCSLTFTGGFVLKTSNIEADINAPPDVMAIMRRKTISDLVTAECPPSTTASEAEAAPASASAAAGSGSASTATPHRRMFVAGLAFDYCVLDTALTAADSGLFAEVYIVYDASRAAHIPGLGTFGTGFLTDPVALLEKVKKAGVKLVPSSALL